MYRSPALACQLVSRKPSYDDGFGEVNVAC